MDNLNQIKDYYSQFWGIKRAISIVKHRTLYRDLTLCIHRKALYILNEFNFQISNYKKIANYHEHVTTLRQLDQLEERLIIFEYNLQKLRNCRSQVAFIKQALRRIPRHFEIDNAPRIIQEFNSQIAGFKEIVCYNENISNKTQLKELEKRLDELDIYNHSLEKLWRALPIECKTYHDAFLIREWFQNPQNQHILSSIINLKLSSYITLLPIELLKLYNLQELDLSVNRITSLPEWMSKYPILRKISLSCNNLKEFPVAICQCITLKTLDLSSNQIEKLPKELMQLSRLTELNLSRNGITAIPKWIRRFAMLQVLNLSYNGLMELPIEICQCLTLETLDVSNNWIQELALIFIVWKDVRRFLISGKRTNPRQLETVNLVGNSVAYSRETL